MKENDYTMVSMDKEKLKNQHYNIKVYTLGSSEGYIENGVRIIDKGDFKRKAKDVLNLNVRQLKVFTDTLVELQLIREDSDNYYWDAIKDNFVKIHTRVVEYFLKTFDPLTFKVYCYLLYKQQQHDYFKNTQAFSFSSADLIRICGYYPNSRKTKEMNDILSTLQDLHFIDYDEPKALNGKNGGWYRRLKSVAYYPPKVIQTSDKITAIELPAVEEKKALEEKPLLYNYDFHGGTYVVKGEYLDEIAEKTDFLDAYIEDDKITEMNKPFIVFSFKNNRMPEKEKCLKYYDLLKQWGLYQEGGEDYVF